ncbi:MAG: hypothetical protein U0232_24180 [Thermomicrobiales bacterium]
MALLAAGEGSGGFDVAGDVVAGFGALEGEGEVGVVGAAPLGLL